jgi:hypothetical protein
MGGDEFAAIGEQPTELIERDVELARFDHELDFFEVLGAIARGARVDEDPTFAVGRSAHAEAAGGRFSAALRLAFGHAINLNDLNHEGHEKHEESERRLTAN